jgi:hypothetical protein
LPCRSFETSNGISHQESGQPKTVGNETPVISQGSNSYTAPDGQQVSFTYVADENGFQVQGSHIPTAPPIPPEIRSALEWNAAHPEEDDDGQRPPPRGERARPFERSNEGFAPLSGHFVTPQQRPVAGAHP